MTRKVYVFIQENTVKCYPNLSELAKAHKIPYYTASKTLAKGIPFSKHNYTVVMDIMTYRTKRYNSSQRDR